MKNEYDPVEMEYLHQISWTIDSDKAFELSIGLKQYRELYKNKGTAK